MKKKNIDNIVWMLFFPCLAIFLMPPLIFNSIMLVVSIIAILAVGWCFYRQENSIVNFIFLILYTLFLILLGMMS